VPASTSHYTLSLHDALPIFLRTDSVCSFKLRLMTASAGDTTWRSSMKSPRCESSSSPIGVSSEMGSCAILSTLRTFETPIGEERSEEHTSELHSLVDIVWRL